MHAGRRYGLEHAGYAGLLRKRLHCVHSTRVGLVAVDRGTVSTTAVSEAEAIADGRGQLAA